MEKTPTHKEFAEWLAAQMAARGFNRSDVARAIWGTVPDTRGYDVAKNRDRIGAYLQGQQLIRVWIRSTRWPRCSMSGGLTTSPAPASRPA